MISGTNQHSIEGNESDNVLVVLHSNITPDHNENLVEHNKTGFNPFFTLNQIKE